MAAILFGNPDSLVTQHPTGPPDTTTIEMHVARGRGLERFILSWVPDIEVLSPSSLRQEVAKAIQMGAERNAG